jgi:hypothetical protein
MTAIRSNLPLTARHTISPSERWLCASASLCRKRQREAKKNRRPRDALHATSRTGAEVLIDQLVIHGERHLFCVPGESRIAALDALRDRPIAVTVCPEEGHSGQY